MNNPVEKRNGVLRAIALFIAAFAIPIFLYWILYLRFYTSTNDAYVEGNAVILMAPINGIVVGIYADDNNYVKEGEVIIKLDQTNYQLAYNAAIIQLALASRDVKQLWENVRQRKADLALKKAELLKTQQDLASRQSLIGSQAVSTEDFQHAQANQSIAQAAVHVAEDQLQAAIASLGSTVLEAHPSIDKAKVALKEAYTNLYRCNILAPVSGYVAQRRVQVGEFVDTTKALLSIIQLDDVWVTANFKETQLGEVRIGQPATIESDFYGSRVIFDGIVQGIGAGTGSQFSLIPPQNATGNWIKIVQRIPVRILLSKEQVKKHPLLLGLSMYVSVSVKDQSGLRLALQPPPTLQYKTSVFEVPLDSIDSIIEEIVNLNLYGNKNGP